MKKDDFRKIYDEIDYTDEFRAEMRRKLSEPTKIRMISDDYENTVEGVDIMKKNKIFHTISTIAACGVLVVAGGAIGFAMKNTSNKDSEPMSSASEKTTNGTSDIEASTISLPIMTTTEPVTGISTTTAASSENVSTYYNKLGLPDIDPANDTDEKITEAIRKYVAVADEYSFESMLPSSYPKTYAEEWYADNNITVDDAVNRGDMIIDGENNWYYSFKENKLTLDGIKEDVLSVYSEDYRLLDEIWNSFKEENGKVYCKSTGGDFAGFLELSDSRIEIKSKNENKIVADVYMDFTSWIVEGYHSYYVPEEMKYLFTENYKYEYPQQITLIREDNGWRVSEYTNRLEIVSAAKEACPEYQAVVDYIYKDLDYNDFIGTFVSAADAENGLPDSEYELNIESIKDGVITFSLSRFRMFSTDFITAAIDNDYRIQAEFDTFVDETEPGIKGYITLLEENNTDFAGSALIMQITETEYPYSEPVFLTFHKKTES